MAFLLYVTTPQGQTLKMTVETYRIEDGFVIFTDPRKGVEKRIDGRMVEIEVLP